MTTTLPLDTTLLDPELCHVHYFNGRLLSAEDCAAEQAVNHLHQRLLGRGLGDGVACGLRVRRAPMSEPAGRLVSVTAGLAVNEAGETLRLTGDVYVALAPKTDNVVAETGCVFENCCRATVRGKPGPSGLFVLTISPDKKLQGRVPVNGLGNRAARCNADRECEGVRFTLCALSLSLPDDARLRNAAAYSYLDLAPLRVMDELDTAWLSPDFSHGCPVGCRDVPLALVRLTEQNGLEFVDEWSVRRRVTAPDAAQPWDYFAGARRAASGEAMFLQFAEHLRSLDASVWPALKAEDRFATLPAVGTLPVGNGQLDWARFLGPLAPPMVTRVDAALLPALVREGFQFEPVTVPDFAKVDQQQNPFAAFEVFEVPEQPSVVMFRRAKHGRVRVVITESSDAPASVIVRASSDLRDTELNGIKDPHGSAIAKRSVYVFDHLPPELHQVTLKAEGYHPMEKQSAFVVKGRTHPLLFELKPKERAEKPDPEPSRTVVGFFQLSPRHSILYVAPASVSIQFRITALEFKVLPAGFPITGGTAFGGGVLQWLLDWRDWLGRNKDGFNTRAETPVLALAPNQGPLLADRGFIASGLIVFDPQHCLPIEASRI